MKQIVSVLMIGILLISCNKKEPKSDGYVISGTAKGVYNGIRIYLKSADEKGTQIPQDTAVVMNETFKFEGKIDYPQMWFLSMNNVGGYIPIMVENEAIDITLDKNNLSDSKITGTKSNEVLADYSNDFKKLADKRMELNQKIGASMNSAVDSLEKARITKEFSEINTQLANYPFEFLKTHNDNYFSIFLIDNIIKSNPGELDPIIQAYSDLDSEIKDSYYGRVVGEKIEVLKKQNESLALLNIGNIAPDFTAPTPDGKELSLYEIRGKATIIDFWAAWCGPCRRENPNVVKVYNKFHDKGLEIISVSLDRPGEKDKWLKAIEDDKLTWHHVSNLNYFNDPVAQQYNIQAIPATFILDADGKIVAKSLRGQALEDKIAELLK